MSNTVQLYEPNNCYICGDIAPEEHHIIYRSQGGHDGPTIPLCADHHRGQRSVHGGGLEIKYFEPGERLEVVDKATGEIVNCWINEQLEMIDNVGRAEYLDEQLRKAKAFIERSFVGMAEALYEIRENELYRSLGCDSMAEYFETLDMTSATGYRLLRVHDRLRLEAGLEAEEIAEIGLHDADRIGQFAVADDKNKREKFEDLKEIAKSPAPRSALNEEIAEYKDADRPPKPVRRLQNILSDLKKSYEDAELVDKLINEAEFYRGQLDGRDKS